MEITTKFYNFVKATQNKQNSFNNLEEKEKINDFLSSLALDLNEFPNENSIKASFEANLSKKYCKIPKML